MPRSAIALLTLLLLAVAAGVPAAASAGVPDNAEYIETWIEPTKAGEPRLHVDILRPKGLPQGEKTPVVLTVSPYTNHSNQNAADFDPTKDKPSERFFDFLEDADLLDQGYTYAMVDLRGTGGSSGCNDWGGPGEQDDVRRAVEFLAGFGAGSFQGSNGKVALYGKSYDGWTGLMGIAQRPRGLAAVVAQEPVVDGYRYLYMNRVRFTNSVLTPTLFQVIDAMPGTVDDTDPRYVNPVRPDCYAQTIAAQQDEDPQSGYWRSRDLIEAVKGSTVPTFFMQGFLENNTKPDAVFDLWNNLDGDNRAWFGQWDHVRGNDRGTRAADPEFFGQPVTGRGSFVREVMGFLDEHLKGRPDAGDPAVVVQSNDGRFRSEQRWPPADSRALTSGLLAGRYTDDGQNSGTGSGGGNGSWSISQPLGHRAHLAGTPRIALAVTGASPRANLVANVYDIAPGGMATMVSRGTTMLDGPGRVDLELYGQDWIFEPGHRVGVLVSSANDEWWVHAPTRQPVAFEAASVRLPWLTFRRDADLEGKRALKLRDYLEDAPFRVHEATIAQRSATFELPPALAERGRAPQAGGSPSPSPASSASGSSSSASAASTPPQPAGSARPSVRRSGRLTASLRQARGRLVVRGVAPRSARVGVRLLRGRKLIAFRRTVARGGRYAVAFGLPRRGRYQVRVSSASVSGAALRTAVIR
jgi:hypothetical protein